jgi:hypothetical protein
MISRGYSECTGYEYLVVYIVNYELRIDSMGVLAKML